MYTAIALLAVLLPGAIPVQTRIIQKAGIEDSNPAALLQRAFHPTLVDHFLEHDAAKLNAAVAAGYRVQRSVGRIFKDPQPGTVPLYYLYNPRVHDSMYTAHEDKRTKALKAGFADKGITGYVYPDAQNGGVGLRTLWSAANRDHFYTTLQVEEDYIHTKAGFAVLPWVEGYLLPV